MARTDAFSNTFPITISSHRAKRKSMEVNERRSRSPIEPVNTMAPPPGGDAAGDKSAMGGNGRG